MVDTNVETTVSEPWSYMINSWASQGMLVVRNLPANAGDVGLISGSGRYPGGKKKWKPTPVFFPGISHGQRSLAGSIQSIGSQRVRHN